MNKKFLIALLAMLLTLSVFMLVACGDCQHSFEGGVCVNCGTIDENYDPSNDRTPCQHWYVEGVCETCGEIDPNYVPNVGGDDAVNATSVRKAVTYGKTGDAYTICGVVYQLETNGYYINDGTASILVKDTAVVVIGDQVVVEGTLAFEGAFNVPSFNATSSEVKNINQTAVLPTTEYVAEFCKIPATAANFYKYVSLVGFVQESNGVYTIALDGSHVVIDEASVSQFASLVGQKVTATVLAVGYSSSWVVKTVSDDAVAVTPADLDVVATAIFDHVATLVPTDTFLSFEVPASYAMEPTVSFAWSVDSVAGVTLEGNVVKIDGLDQDVTIPLKLTLSCDGKTKEHVYNVSCNADYVFDYVQEQLPTIYPNSYVLPDAYPNQDIAFAWAVKEGSVIAVTQESETVNDVTTTNWVLASEDVKEDTTVKIELTITAGSNVRSHVFDVVLKAPLSISLAEVANQELYTPVKVSGTVLLTAYNQTGTTCSLLIYDANYKMLQIDFAGTGLDASKNFVRPSPIDEYAEGDKVSVYGRVAERTVAGITIKSLSVKEVAVDEKAATDYQFSLTGFDVVNLSTTDDYNAFMANVESYGGTTIVKVSAPYLVYSGSSSYNFIRFGPDATSARDGYSTKIDNVTKKRVFCLSRNLLGEKCPGLETQLAVPKKSAGAALYSTFEIYAVPMYMGTDTLQFVPLGANFYTYTK